MSSTDFNYVTTIFNIYYSRLHIKLSWHQSTYVLLSNSCFQASWYLSLNYTVRKKVWKICSFYLHFYFPYHQKLIGQSINGLNIDCPKWSHLRKRFSYFEEPILQFGKYTLGQCYQKFLELFLKDLKLYY